MYAMAKFIHDVNIYHDIQLAAKKSCKIALQAKAVIVLMQWLLLLLFIYCPLHHYKVM